MPTSKARDDATHIYEKIGFIPNVNYLSRVPTTREHMPVYREDNVANRLHSEYVMVG